MEAIMSAFALLAAVALGLTAGALLAEGAILVPFWRSLQPASFLSWYKEYAALLQKFFGLLEVAAAVLTIAAATMNWGSQGVGSRLLVVSALLAVAVLGVFPLYFQRVNAGFAAGAIAADRVTEELRRWSSWHWLRTIMATAAFISAVAALMSGAVTPAA
jgi:hypothetical protein